MEATGKTYFDIFAGIGLVEYALDQNAWDLKLAVDYDKRKERIYQQHFSSGDRPFVTKDVYHLNADDLPTVYLGHASFPCTDVSNAGGRRGMGEGKESSAIDSLLGLLYSKPASERPKVLLTENVKGLLTSNQGSDIRYLLQHYNKLGYTNDLLLVDARYFVPQSRQRVFILSFKEGLVPPGFTQFAPSESWVRPKAILRTIYANTDLNWTFLKVPTSPQLLPQLPSIIDASDESFWVEDRAQYLYSQMSAKHQHWIDNNRGGGQYKYATAFRRMRVRDGIKQSTAEIRTDGLAGCLRTAKGGSARQILIRVGKGEMKVRLLNEMECAKLMGAPAYKISKDISRNDYLFAFGDGVCASVIEWLDKTYLSPIFKSIQTNPIIQGLDVEKKNGDMKNNQRLNDAYQAWRGEHWDDPIKLPIKGRLYGALIVLYNLKEADHKSDWSFSNTLAVNSTDKGSHFGDRSIKNHTSHRLNLALQKLNRPNLKPRSGGEAGRTSTGTKRAGLGIIQMINYEISKVEGANRQKLGLAAVNQLEQLVIKDLEAHEELGGIEVGFSRQETIGAFIAKLVNYKTNRPGSVLQHLVGAKLELRYRDNPAVEVIHHKAATADVQLDRLGDFDIGNSVIHVTKSPTPAHFRKAYENAKSGRTVYILIPEDRLGMASAAKDIDDNYTAKVNVYSIEQFIAQNVDEISLFKRELSVENLKELVRIYNELIETYEGDNSLKIVPPDFGG